MIRVSSYLKMRVLGAVENAAGKTIIERIRKTSQLAFIDEGGKPRTFTWRTIQTWYTRFKTHGVTGVVSKDRSDKGKTRKLSPEELLEAINQVLPHFRNKNHNRLDLYRMAISKGVINPNQLAQTTFYRFLREYDLLKDNFEENRKRLAFAMQYANQLWQADTLYGPHVKDAQGRMIQTRLIAFIDDASRVICHAQFFFHETVDSLITALKSAFYKRGVPQQLYVDNGSIYSSMEISLICARVGCILRHTPVRDGASKGKIERFFRTVRDQFLARTLDLSSLSSLNRQLNIWVEEEYNSKPHSALGMAPISRFALDTHQIKFLPPDQVNDELFYAEEDRQVKKDNTFSFKSVRFEAPADLREKKISIRFDRANPGPVIVYYKNQRMGEAVKLNLYANALLKRGGAI
jgi:putative transposase